MAIKIVEYTAPVAVNPYTEDIAELIKAGEHVAGVIEIPVAEKNKARVKFAKAANAANRTAKLVSENVVGDKVELTFKLTERHAARRGPSESKHADKPVETPAVEAAVETPAVETAPETKDETVSTDAPATPTPAAKPVKGK